MKRSLQVSVDGAALRVSYVLVAALSVFFLGGAVLAAWFGGRELLSSRVFSPFSFFCSDAGLLRILTGNFITYSTFVILGVIFSASAFGFFVIPPLTFLLGFSLSASVLFLLREGLFLRCFLLCLPLWAVFACLLLLYYSLCFSSSFLLFRLCGANAEEDRKFSLPQSLRVFYAAACFSTVLAAASSFLEFFLFSIL